MRGSASNATPGACTRGGPKRPSGPAQGENCGSVRKFPCAVCSSQVAWPIHVATISSPRGAGGGGRGARHSAGRAERRCGATRDGRDAAGGVFESRRARRGRAVSRFVRGQRRVWTRGVEPRRGGRNFCGAKREGRGVREKKYRSRLQ